MWGEVRKTVWTSVKTSQSFFYLIFNKFYSDNQKNWEPDTGRSGYVDRISIGTWHIPKDNIYRNFHHQNKEFYSLYSIPEKQDFEEFKKKSKVFKSRSRKEFPKNMDAGLVKLQPSRK